jgi:hypothetical protein
VAARPRAILAGRLAATPDWTAECGEVAAKLDMIVLMEEVRCWYGCQERKVVRSRWRVLRTCIAMAMEAHNRVRKARIEMASKTCIQLSKDSKMRYEEGAEPLSS